MLLILVERKASLKDFTVFNLNKTF